MTLCADKCKYKTKLQAVTAIAYRLRKGAEVYCLRYYRCPICHMWHITHQRIKKSEGREGQNGKYELL